MGIRTRARTRAGRRAAWRRYISYVSKNNDPARNCSNRNRFNINRHSYSTSHLVKEFSVP